MRIESMLSIIKKEILNVSPFVCVEIELYEPIGNYEKNEYLFRTDSFNELEKFAEDNPGIDISEFTSRFKDSTIDFDGYEIEYIKFGRLGNLIQQFNKK